MISRLTTFATAFAVLATASLAYAAGARHEAQTTPGAAVASIASAKPVRIVQLERVVIVAKRLPQQAI